MDPFGVLGDLLDDCKTLPEGGKGWELLANPMSAKARVTP